MTEPERLVEVAYFQGMVEIGRGKSGSVISGGRSRSHNRSVRGNIKSLHIWALGTDVDFPAEAPARKAMKFWRSKGFWCKYKPAGHTVHVQRWPKGTGPRP